MIVHTRLESAHLAGNLLGDPSERDLFVYLPPGYEDSDERYPTAYLLQAFGETVAEMVTPPTDGLRWRPPTDASRAAKGPPRCWRSIPTRCGRKCESWASTGPASAIPHEPGHPAPRVEKPANQVFAHTADDRRHLRGPNQTARRHCSRALSLHAPLPAGYLLVEDGKTSPPVVAQNENRLRKIVIDKDSPAAIYESWRGWTCMSAVPRKACASFSATAREGIRKWYLLATFLTGNACTACPSATCL